MQLAYRTAFVRAVLLAAAIAAVPAVGSAADGPKTVDEVIALSKKTGKPILVIQGSET